MRTERTTRWRYGSQSEWLWRLVWRTVFPALLLPTAFPASASAVAVDSSRASFVQVVNQADPELRWPQPAPIPYGEALTSQQLSATAGVAGTYTYSPALGTVLQPGMQTLAVQFQPASTNFKSATTTVSITVMPPDGGTFSVAPSTPGSPGSPGQSIGRVNVSGGNPGVVPLVLSPVGQFFGKVTLSCITPADLQCVFAPSVISLADEPKTVILTVSVIPTGTGGRQPEPYPRDPQVAKAKTLPSAAFCFGVMLLGWRCRSYRRRVSRGVLPLALVALACLTATLTGCAGADGFVPVQIKIVAKSGTESLSLPLTVFVYRP